MSPLTYFLFELQIYWFVMRTGDKYVLRSVWHMKKVQFPSLQAFKHLFYFELLPEHQLNFCKQMLFSYPVAYRKTRITV